MNPDNKAEYSPSNFEDLLKDITPDVYQLLKMAVELGRWETGDKLTEEQKALCLQAVIAYDEYNLEPEQRVGFISQKKPAGLDKNNGTNNNA